MDILARLPKDDELYTDFNVRPRRIKKGYLDDDGNAVYEYTDILTDPDDEIAVYCEDGYVSLTCHCRAVRLLTLNSDGIGGYYKSQMQELTLSREMGVSIADIYDRYGGLKAAFVDGSGKILRVSDVCDTEYTTSEPYAIIINGGRLTLRLYGTGDKSTISALAKAALTAVGVMMIFALIVLMINIANKRKKKKE
ncbi:MAG: hypothetical protein IJ555_03745 [Ruminococcus sp.]|nr:hypothetical protein [Ruminococcus sp.]